MLDIQFLKMGTSALHNIQTLMEYYADNKNCANVRDSSIWLL